jgi:osmoprotectant transport system substrate-binding protein
MRRGSMVLRLVAAAAAVAVTLTACGGDDDEPASGGSKGDLKVGAYDFPEGRLLANIYVDWLNKAGYKATFQQLAQRQTAQPALQKGDVDVLPEYVSSALNFYQPNTATVDDAKNYATLKELGAAKGVTYYTPAPAKDNYAFVVTKDFSEKNSITTLSQLAAYSQKNPIAFGGTPECKDASYCKGGLEKVYGMKFGAYKTIVLSSQSAVDGLVQNEYVAAVFNSSDGVLSPTVGNPVVVLKDDKALNPNDYIVPAVNSKKATPELESTLNELSKKITQEELLRMNQETQNERRPVEKVAEDFVG